MNTYQTIESVVDFIENHLYDRITLDDISQATYVSKYHLHRIFSLLTNLRIMDYVRSRKLSSSIHELMSSKDTVCRIAASYGFEYEQSYIRAFKKQFGLSPTTFRKTKPNCCIVEKIDMRLLKSIVNGVVIPCQIVFMPELCLAGIRYHINHEENSKKFMATEYALSFIHHDRLLIKNAVSSKIYFGLSRYDVIKPREGTYQPSIQVLSPDSILSNMSVDILPKNKYAVFQYVGFHPLEDVTLRTLTDTYHHAFSWLAISPYQKQLYHFEWVDLSTVGPDYCEVYLYFPIS